MCLFTLDAGDWPFKYTIFISHPTKTKEQKDLPSVQVDLYVGVIRISLVVKLLRRKQT